MLQEKPEAGLPGERREWGGEVRLHRRGLVYLLTTAEKPGLSLMLHTGRKGRTWIPNSSNNNARIQGFGIT